MAVVSADDLRDSRVTVSDIFNQQMVEDRNQNLGAAGIIGRNKDYNREPDYYLNIFNISTLPFVRHRPPDFPTIQIKACPKGEPYVLAVRVADTIRYKWITAETGAPAFDSIAGERWATDLINPANLGNEMWTEVTNPALQQFHGGGDDLSVRGVFWTRNEVPTAEELGKARSRMENHYRGLVRQAEQMAADPKRAGEIGEEHHHAADYLRVNATWHMRTVLGEPCPNCGDMVNPGIAFHMSSSGMRCILDWKRAVSAGAAKKDEVPEELRWWEEEPEHRGPGRPRKEL